MNSRLDKLTPGVPAKLNLLCDLVLVTLAVHLATRATNEASFLFTDAGMILVALSALGWVVGAAVLRLYNPCTPRSMLDTVALSILLVSCLAVGLTVVEARLLDNEGAFSPLTFGGVAFCWTTASRFLLFRPLHQIADPVEDVLVVGTGPLGAEAAERLTSQGRHRVVGFLAFDGEVASGKLHGEVLGKTSDILGVLASHPVSEVYVAGKVLAHGQEMQDVVSSCEQVGVPFALPVNALHLERARLLDPSLHHEDGWLHYLSTDTKPVQLAVKRLVDIACSAFALVVLSPLLLTVAALIKITSPGPVFFRQKRVGLHGAEFDMLKFRSMVVNADAMKDKLAAQNEMKGGPVFKMKNDPRITPIGRFIRKFSIDELPQLVNILRGDMTIVGPRPAVPKEVAQYKVWQRRRLSVRPGLTCYWQVGGRNEIGFDEWMQLDLRYVDNWSLAVDAALILKTFPVVLTGKGAS